MRNVIKYIGSLILIVLSAHTSAQTEKMSLDVMEWEDYESGIPYKTEKEEYTYQEPGVVNSAVLSLWNKESQSYGFYSKIISKYQNGSLKSKTYSDYDTGSKSWRDSLKREYSYHTNGLISLMESYLYSELGEWEKETKEEYLYDNDGNLIEFDFFEWNAELNDWEAIERNSYGYDSNGNLSGYTSWVWDFIFEEWLYYDKEEYKYEDGWTKFAYSEWDEMKEEWTPVYKDSSTYSTDGLKYAYLSCYWKKSESAWINFSKEVHELDLNDRVTLYTEYEWNENTLRWDYYDKEEYQYDSYGNVTLFIDYNKSSQYNVWVESLKEVYGYNHNHSVERLVIPFEEPVINDVYFNTMLVNIQVFDWNSSNNSWRPSSDGHFTYNLYQPQTPSAVQRHKSWSAYPVPFHDRLIIEGLNGAMVNLCDICGKIVIREEKISEYQLITTKKLNAGIYILKITLPSGEYITKKVLKM